MRSGFFWLVAAAVLFFQIALSGKLAVGGVEPDLCLVLAVFLAIRLPEDRGLPAAWGLGVAVDLLSAGPAGWHALAYLGAAAVARGIKGLVFGEQFWAYVIFAFLAVFAGHLFLGTVVWAKGGAGWWHHLSHGASVSLYSALAAPFLYALLKKGIRPPGYDLHS